ncbi:TPA: head-tail adaptor protein [Vibrio cholerae]|uniref:head-tail adaptor protein n=1 Tax=Vibrio cholerae TaxID=666 RepID=UPI0006E6E065|nr:head-tail adaptor protein [Vibrio cholerae]KQA29517.1 phage head-tail adapter protein [Vibrio paracholerae 877-163]EGR1131331.1 head-tail adaptor protein [Vibrio cholerae]EKF9299659.1 head-tail adaptor protein [Vibrio cholerae]EKF9564395.1 head-tail adaptor protein [Vibrio cholerae]MBJ6971762.1 head-tail adaptor protein [Vibrio cholerae]
MLSHRLTHVIQIQEPIESQDDDSGAIITTWQTIEIAAGKPNIPAEVLTGPGKEVSAAGSKYPEVVARINVRWFPFDMQKLYECRILWEGQIFGIHSVDTDRTARQEWRFKCKAGVNQEGS